MHISSQACTFYWTRASEQRTADKFPSLTATFATREAWFDQSCSVCGSPLDPSCIPPPRIRTSFVDLFFQTAGQSQLPSWQGLPEPWCHPAGSQTTSERCQQCGISTYWPHIPFSLFFPQEHIRAQGAKWEELGWHLATFPGDSSRILRQFVAYVSCRWCGFSGKKNESNYNLEFSAEFWMESQSFIYYVLASQFYSAATTNDSIKDNYTNTVTLIYAPPLCY